MPELPSFPPSTWLQTEGMGDGDSNFCYRPSLDEMLQESTVYVFTLSRCPMLPGFSWQHGTAAWKPLLWVPLAWGQKKSISLLLFIKLLQHYGSKLRWGRESLFLGKCCLSSGCHSASERNITAAGGVRVLRSWETFSKMYMEPDITLCIAPVSHTILFHMLCSSFILQVRQETALQFHS